MKILVPLFLAACATRTSLASASCDQNYKPEKLKGDFQITKAEKARLKCDYDLFHHKKIDPPEYIDGKGCYLDLKILGKKKVKEKYGAYHVMTSDVHVYADGSLCDRKVGEKLNLTVGEVGCSEGHGFHGCEKKEKLRVIGGNPDFADDMECMAGRWTVYPN